MHHRSVEDCANWLDGSLGRARRIELGHIPRKFVIHQAPHSDVGRNCSSTIIFASATPLLQVCMHFLMVEKPESFRSDKVSVALVPSGLYWRNLKSTGRYIRACAAWKYRLKPVWKRCICKARGISGAAITLPGRISAGTELRHSDNFQDKSKAERRVSKTPMLLFAAILSP